LRLDFCHGCAPRGCRLRCDGEQPS
jgi:hypothetical protein